MGLGARMHREGSSQQPMAGTRGEEKVGRQLLVKGFPSWLGREDKESLLSHFGAVRVDVMPTSGRMVSGLSPPLLQVVVVAVQRYPNSITCG